MELAAGPHQLVVKRGDEELYATSFSLRPGGELLLEPRWTPSAEEPPLETAIPPRSTPAANFPGPGWTSLFNGRDLEGWNVLGGDAWQVVDGAIDNAKGPPGSYLASESSFGDFELDLEYRMAPGANSGVYFRAPADLSRNSTEYLEVQLLDTQRPSPLTNSPDRINGALYGVAAVSQEAPVIPNAWNRLTLRAEGDRVTVRVNGVLVVDADLEPLRQEHPSMPGLESGEGHLHLQYHNGKTEFRNLRIKDLTPTPRSHQGHAYQFFAETLSWHEAQSRCEELGGHLAIIESAEENAFVAGLIAEAGWEDAWIGITDEAEEGTWLTVRGETIDYTHWYDKQPNNKPPGEHYALITNRIVGQPVGWRWCDQPAEPTQHQPGFVCEWDDATDSKPGEPGAQ
jgi:hypothetical protein